MKPRITAVVCSYDRYDMLSQALECLSRQTLPRDEFAVFVIDNSPDDERAADFAGRWRQLENACFLREATPGLSRARNKALENCETEFIAYIDDDALAEPDWLTEILRAFDAFGAEAEIVGGRIVPAFCGERPAWLHDSLLGFLSIVDWGGSLRAAAPQEWLAGCNISFRTEALLRYGGFAAELGRRGAGGSLLSNEDNDVIARARENGAQVLYQPEAVVRHQIMTERLTPAWFRRRVVWQAVSDRLTEPEKEPGSARDNWESVVGYAAQLPPRERGWRCLGYQTEDPDLFRHQLGALYSAAAVLLAGFEGVEL